MPRSRSIGKMDGNVMQADRCGKAGSHAAQRGKSDNDHGLVSVRDTGGRLSTHVSGASIRSGSLGTIGASAKPYVQRYVCIIGPQ
jgi:hypothetical protein